MSAGFVSGGEYVNRRFASDRGLVGTYRERVVTGHVHVSNDCERVVTDRVRISTADVRISRVSVDYVRFLNED